MDFIKDQISGSGSKQEGEQKQHEKKEDQGFMDQMYNKANTAAGGGKASEKNEDLLDKGIDYVQENFLGQGKQDNESAVEQAKDEQISDFIRGQYKSQTGSDFPIKDKET